MRGAELDNADGRPSKKRANEEKETEVGVQRSGEGSMQDARVTESLRMRRRVKCKEIQMVPVQERRGFRTV